MICGYIVVSFVIISYAVITVRFLYFTGGVRAAGELVGGVGAVCTGPAVGRTVFADVSELQAPVTLYEGGEVSHKHLLVVDVQPPQASGFVPHGRTNYEDGVIEVSVFIVISFKS